MGAREGNDTGDWEQGKREDGKLDVGKRYVGQHHPVPIPLKLHLHSPHPGVVSLRLQLCDLFFPLQKLFPT